MAAGRGGKRRSSVVTNPQDHHSPKPLTPELLALLSTVTSSASTFLAENDLNLIPSQALALESLISSTSKSLSILDSRSTTSNHQLLPIDCWFRRFIDEVTSDADVRWIDSFRMSKRSFNLLLQLLAPSLASEFESLPRNYVLGAAIYRLAHGADYQYIGRRFAMESLEACRAFFVVCKAVHRNLGNLFEFEGDMSRIKLGFNWMGLPNCCGVLGMDRFGGNGGVLVQAVVDSEERFVDLSTGWPSSMEVGTILRHSKLYGAVVDGALLEEGIYRENEGMSFSQYLLGESCFPFLPWLLKPYDRTGEDDGFSLEEETFNAAHARGTKLVRSAFGRVKGRWKLLMRQWKEENFEFLPYVIVMGCLLHNFLIKSSDFFSDEENIAQWPKEGAAPEGEETERAKKIRDTIASHLSRQCQGNDHPNLITKSRHNAKIPASESALVTKNYASTA